MIPLNVNFFCYDIFAESAAWSSLIPHHSFLSAKSTFPSLISLYMTFGLSCSIAIFRKYSNKQGLGTASRPFASMAYAYQLYQPKMRCGCLSASLSEVHFSHILWQRITLIVRRPGCFAEMSFLSSGQRALREVVGVNHIPPGRQGDNGQLLRRRWNECRSV